MGENRLLRNSFVYLIILVAALTLFYQYFGRDAGSTSEKTLGEIRTLALNGQISKITQTVGENEIKAVGPDNQTLTARKNNSDDDIGQFLQDAAKSQSDQILLQDPNNKQAALQPFQNIDKIKIENKSAPAWGGILGAALTFLLPTLLLIGFFVFFMRQAQGSNNQAMSFGKSKARMFTGDKPSVTFADVAGQEEAKQDLSEVVEFLKFPEKFAQLGARIPRGVLMVGPPGTGKTLLSRAVAGEAGVPFFSISGSEFVEMFVGVGASRVRDLFEQAKRNAPCLTGDTVVTLSGGRQVTIGEMYDTNMIGASVPGMTNDYRLVDSKVINITRKKPTDLFQINAATSDIKATGNHLFPILRGDSFEWIRAEQLTAGDYVAIPRQIKTTEHVPLFAEFLPADAVITTGDSNNPIVWSQTADSFISHSADNNDDRNEYQTHLATKGLALLPMYLDESVVYVCGLLVADGYMRKQGDRSIQFINTELVLHDLLSTIIRERFDYTTKRYMDNKHYETVLPQGTHPQELQDCYSTYIFNRVLCDAIRNIQTRILELPAHLIGAWLRGVFDGDGCVRVSNTSPQVIISAWKPRENQMIRDALLRLGIVTGRSERAGRGDDGNIVVTGIDNINIFLGLVGASHPKKQEQLGQLADLLVGKISASRLDAIPVNGLLKEARLSIGMGQRAFSSANRVTNYERGVHTPPRLKVQSIVQAMEAWCEEHVVVPTEQVNHLKQLAHSDIMWAKINRIEAIQPEEWVYDLCLDGINHNFIANNVVVHNCIIFIDEVDAVGRQRGAGLGGSHDEREQTLNQILVEMDGFDTSTNVIVIAATNRPDVLDPALVRPGRFDRQVVLDAPDLRGRIEVLKVHSKGKPLAEDVNLEAIAKLTPGSSGADLANIINEAAILAARHSRKRITMQDMQDATERTMLGGPERRSRVMTTKQKELTAFHEAGHAIVAKSMPNSNPVHKVTIIPRGLAGGYTLMIPDEDQMYMSVTQFEAQIAIALGGRVAEELVLGDFTTGASGDIQQSTRMARAMVTRYGMSAELGPIAFGEKEEMIFMGREISEQRNYSDETSRKIDSEVKRLVDEGHARARLILNRDRELLNRMAEALIEHESLDGAALKAILDDVTPYVPNNGVYREELPSERM